MRVIDLGDSGQIARRTVLCLGNFDGVHKGHQKLISDAKRMRDERFPDAEFGVFCFHGLSSDHLSANPPKHLTTDREKLAYFAECGAELVIMADFPSVRDTEPKAFVCEILQNKCRAVAVACGFNHRFGKGGRGDADMLKAFYGENLFVCPAVEIDGSPVSSTRIRSLVANGDVSEAARLMGHPYRLHATVTHGAEIGRKIGFPTVNQSFERLSVLPKNAVYYTTCEIDGKTYAGLTDVGTRPTVGGVHEVRCETNLLDYHGDLYGREITVSFLRFIRDERKFDSIENLQKQIEKDREIIRNSANSDTNNSK